MLAALRPSHPSSALAAACPLPGPSSPPLPAATRMGSPPGAFAVAILAICPGPLMMRRRSLSLARCQPLSLLPLPLALCQAAEGRARLAEKRAETRAALRDERALQRQQQEDAKQQALEQAKEQANRVRQRTAKGAAKGGRSQRAVAQRAQRIASQRKATASHR